MTIAEALPTSSVPRPGSSEAALPDIEIAELDSATFRAVLGHFPTGVTIITGLAGSVPIGTTSQSFTSLSLDPPLVLFCPSRSSETYPKLRQAGAFCVNVLGEHQEHLSRRFASKDSSDRFTGVGWHPAPSGAPVLDGAVAWVDCSIEAEYDGGDHLIVVGRVRALHSPAGVNPLLFYRGGYHQFGN